MPRASPPVSAGFELGNEPNAAGYWWGTAAQFGPVADAAYAALVAAAAGAPLPPRVACCAFATELAGYGLANGTEHGFHDFARGAAARYDGAPLSWHFYRHSSHDGERNVSTYANVTRFYGAAALRGSVVSEWGLFTYNSPRTTAAVSSPLLMLELVRLLAFAYDVGVAEIDAHCLMDHPQKGGHNCYFDRFGAPKASYGVYALAARVIRGGYRVARRGPPARRRAGGAAGVLTTIEGRASGLLIVCACGADADGAGTAAAAYVLPAEWGVVASSGFAYDGAALPAGQWMVVQDEPPRGWRASVPTVAGTV